MKIRIFLFISVCFLVFSFLISCDKHHAKKLAGSYTCQVHSYSISGGTVTLDTNYTETLEVKQEKNKLNFLNQSYHIDTFWNEKRYYTTFTHGYLDIQFKNDSINYEMRNGGQGGYGIITYKGKKQN
ncbi:MAG: hypothetical protein ACK5B9_12605 [Flavobacteriia bacterium]